MQGAEYISQVPLKMILLLTPGLILKQTCFPQLSWHCREGMERRGVYKQAHTTSSAISLLFPFHSPQESVLQSVDWSFHWDWTREQWTVPTIHHSSLTWSNLIRSSLSAVWSLLSAPWAFPLCCAQQHIVSSYQFLFCCGGSSNSQEISLWLKMVLSLPVSMVSSLPHQVYSCFSVFSFAIYYKNYKFRGSVCLWE